MEPEKFVQYVLVDAKTGQPVTYYHQDDEETAVTSPTLGGLLSRWGDLCDCGTDYVLANMTGDEIRDPANDKDAVYKIRKQLIKERDLNPAELTRLKGLLDKNAGRVARYKKTYGYD